MRTSQRIQPNGEMMVVDVDFYVACQGLIFWMVPGVRFGPTKAKLAVAKDWDRVAEVLFAIWVLFEASSTTEQIGFCNPYTRMPAHQSWHLRLSVPIHAGRWAGAQGRYTSRS